MNKSKIYHLLLGIGLGIIITSSLNIAFNKTETIEYTDEEIKEKAESLGMISIKDNIEKNDKEKNDKEKNEQEKQASESKAKIEKEPQEEVQPKAESKPEEDIEKQKKSESQEKKQSSSKVFAVDSEDTASTITRKLKKDGIIENENEFKNLVIKYNLQRKFRTGTYQIKENSTYEEVLKKLIKENELKSAGFLE